MNISIQPIFIIVMNILREQIVTHIANRPGLFSGQRDIYDSSFKTGDVEGNAKFVEMIKNDASAMGLNFQEYKEEMSGGYAVLLVIKPGRDYHWYRPETEATRL